MFNTIEAFKRQFTPVEGGYLVHPSRRSGGKLVTEAEYEQLVADWERVVGRPGRLKAVGAVFVLIAIWTLLVDRFLPAEWRDTSLIAFIVMGMSARLLWASTAPRRLVKDRSPVTAPRQSEEAGREARAVLDWPVIAFALLISGFIFFGSVTASDRSTGTWAWLIGSGGMFGLYLWIAAKKLLDGRS
jgi:hypothetical protein